MNKRLYKKGKHVITVTGDGWFYLWDSNGKSVFSSSDLPQVRDVLCKVVPLEECIGTLKDGTQDIRYGLRCSQCGIRR